MATSPELTAYLDSKRIEIDAEFPKHKETTAELFSKASDLFCIEPADMSDNRAFRYILTSLRELVCYAFEAGVSKAYLRLFFKALNSETIVSCLADCSKSRAKDIRYVMDRLLSYFTYSWQGYREENRDLVLMDVLSFIDNMM